MKIILFFFFLASNIFAEPIVNIKSNSSTIKDFELSYFINNTAKLQFKDTKLIQFIKGKNKDSLGAGIKDVWIKIKVSNTTSNKQTLFLHQDLAYTFISIQYFEVDNNDTLLNTKIISPFGSSPKQEMNGADAIYKFSLNPKETKTIYIQQKTPAYHFYNFYIFSQKESIKYLIYEKVDIVLLVGLLMALSLYNLLIYISSRYKEYLYYSLYLISSTLWIFYIYGSLAHYINLYGQIPFRFNFGLMFAPIFLALFVQSIFNTKNNYKKEHFFLNSIIIILSLTILYAIMDFSHALQYLSLILNYVMLVFLFVGISIYKKGDKIIKIFLFAHIFYLIFNVYGILFYMGIVDSTYISSHGIGIGIAIEALLLSYLVSYKFKIMEQEKELDRIKHMDLKLLAATDSMTKLYNRRYFDEIATNILSLCKRGQESLSILILDIDNFKNVNDTYGHQFGDDVIISISNKLIKCQRTSDIVCRYGGEEFVILLPNTSIIDASLVAEKIRLEIESSSLALPSNKEFKFTISVGISEIDLEKEININSALKRADEALYIAKNSGKNNIKVKTLSSASKVS